MGVVRSIPRMRSPYDWAGWTDQLAAKCPNGVRFNNAGFPDSSQYSRARVQMDDLAGIYTKSREFCSSEPSGRVLQDVIGLRVASR
jgi:hypothetical protein